MSGMAKLPSRPQRDYELFVDDPVYPGLIRGIVVSHHNQAIWIYIRCGSEVVRFGMGVKDATDLADALDGVIAEMEGA